MKLHLDYNDAISFLKGSELKPLLAQAEQARETLLSGSGAGNEFLGWLDLDENITGNIADIEKTAEEIRDTSDVLVVIGIGGSYLGARAALEFITSPSYNLIPKNTPEIYFAGNYMSPDAISEIISIIGNRDFSVNVISKSGTTTEPAIAFRIFRNLLEQKYGRKGAASRIYATTDKEKGALKSVAGEKGFKTFVVPENVGGRYSVFTPVGLLPLAVAGIDIRKLLFGASQALEFCKKANGTDNPALLYAAIRNGLYRDGKKIEIFADFDPALRYTGEWWKQLFGESEGKDGKGLFPAAVDYSADLHSMGQYIQSGERSIFETFINVEKSYTSVSVPGDPDSGDGLEYLSGRELSWANSMALEAAKSAHTAGGVPTFKITIPDKSAGSFGTLAGFFMFACGVSGYMLGVNPFNQPGVEAYKENMFRLLGKPGYGAEISAHK